MEGILKLQFSFYFSIKMTVEKQYNHREAGQPGTEGVDARWAGTTKCLDNTLTRLSK